MQRLNKLGKLILIIGVLALFRKVRGSGGFGGYVDNSFEILIVSLGIILIGATLLFISSRQLK